MTKGATRSLRCPSARVAETSASVRRERLRLNGIVQGVGFRPYVYRLARDCRLGGFVQNNGEGVCIEVEGTPASLSAFQTRLRTEVPRLARIVNVRVEPLAVEGESEFRIRASGRGTRVSTFISPDVGTCDDCARELFDPDDRRHHYPFINCTNCGPRYTITRSIPYDRSNTSMSAFELCGECRGEYEDPEDRRFHAQPNACDACGPRVTLCGRRGEAVQGEPLEEAIRLLLQGKILAVRGLGGFHLAVDARNDAAVRELRRRKGRADKPFALMAPDLVAVRRFCAVRPEEARQLLLPARPIVLLQRLEGAAVASSVAPGCTTLGFMLPIAPLHHLRLRGHFEALVMTSGNSSEEPIAIANDEARRRLGKLADFFLAHDREILQRCDDSIVRVMGGEARLLRRSRGYVPGPVVLSHPVERMILAVGGELKNTIALARGETVFFSQHIGDLDNPRTLGFFEDSIAHLGAILEIRPEAIAHDLHPEYLSTKWAGRQADLPRIGVQHHHAHLASVMAENGIQQPTIGIILDGTGYGTDGTLWGGEVLVGDYRDFQRHAWLEPLPLPGGSVAIREPWRMALSALHAAYGPAAARMDLPLLEERAKEVAVLLQMIDRRLNCPLTSGCGRLFDAVAALAGVRGEVSYEAQAAIELETAIEESADGDYAAAAGAAGSSGPLSVGPLIRAIVEDVRSGETRGAIAARFHRSLAAIFLGAAEAARRETGVRRVALSGGVFQNLHLLQDLVGRLQARGFQVLTHRQVPTNDGGLALGQIAVASARLATRREGDPR